MEIYARHRREGKTTDLIRLAVAEFLYIVCPNRQMAAVTWDLARRMGLDIPQPITWAEFAGGHYYGRGIRGFAIDNLEMCVQGMTTVPIRAISVNLPGVPAEVTQPQ